MKSSGLHIIHDMLKCQCDKSLLNDHYFIKGYLDSIINNSGLIVLHQHFHSFGEDEGYTGIFVLEESHIAIHTWPEEKKVQYDIFVCNYTCNNEGKAEFISSSLVGIFNPIENKTHQISRE